MSNRIMNEYTIGIADSTDLKNYLSPKTLTSVGSEVALTENSYFSKFNDYTVFKSDGVGRVGLLFDFTSKILLGDLIEFSCEARSIDGVKPVIYWEEWTDTSSMKLGNQRIENTNNLEFHHFKRMITNRQGNRRGRLFIGLDVGEIGTFSVRFPVIKHFAQIKYSRVNETANTKMYQLSKNTGTWVIETTNSYRKLDTGTISLSPLSLFIAYNAPFIVDVPQAFCMTNKVFAGWTIHFGFRSKDQIELLLFDANGIAKSWADVPDGAIFNIELKAGLYY